MKLPISAWGTATDNQPRGIAEIDPANERSGYVVP
jgi:hypothetical protein